MAKYVYPAVIEDAEDGFNVTFPDVDGCFTCGATLSEAMEMAQDALCLMLYDLEKDGETIPEATDIRKICASDNEIVTLIGCDTLTC